ncbi:hypothetical protein COOONC_09525, partial [Cooperia oncophora]
TLIPGAYCVCIATALLQTSGLIPSPSIVTDEDGNLTWEEQHLDMIRKWATAAESLIHGRASGLDAAVCTYGGVASFKPGTRIEHLKNLLTGGMSVSSALLRCLGSTRPLAKYKASLYYQDEMERIEDRLLDLYL